MKKLLSIITALSFIVFLGFTDSNPAHANTVWEPVNVTSSPFVDTMADGTEVTVTFGPAAGYWGSTYPPAIYKTDASGAELTSTIRFTFSRPITSLRTYYAFVGYGDQEEFTTNLGPVDLSKSPVQGGNLVSSTGNFVPNQPQGTYSNLGIVTSTFTTSGTGAPSNSAILELSFPTGITYLEARGAPSGPGDDGINLIGLELAVTSYTLQFNANGGQGTMANETVYGAATLPQNSFTRSGYEFTGWNTQANGQGTPYSNLATVPSANLTLYAQWRSTELAQTGVNSQGIELISISLLGLGYVVLALSRVTRKRTT